MLRNLVILINIYVFAVLSSYGQKADAKSAEESAIRQILSQLETAWAGGDGKAFAAPFAEDADYVVINGMFLKGREAIGQGHQQIFDTIYKDTKLKLEIRQIRFLRPDAAVVHTKANMVKNSEAFPAAAKAFPGFVLNKDGGKWQLIAFQNTANAESEANKK